MQPTYAGCQATPSARQTKKLHCNTIKVKTFWLIRTPKEETAHYVWTDGEAEPLLNIKPE